MVPPALNTFSLTITGHYPQRKNFISFQYLSFKEVSVLQQQKKQVFSQGTQKDAGKAQGSRDKRRDAK